MYEAIRSNSPLSKSRAKKKRTPGPIKKRQYQKSIPSYCFDRTNEKTGNMNPKKYAIHGNFLWHHNVSYIVKSGNAVFTFKNKHIKDPRLDQKSKKQNELNRQIFLNKKEKMTNWTHTKYLFLLKQKTLSKKIIHFFE